MFVNLTDLSKNSDAAFRDLGVFMAHELLGHGYRYDSGTYNRAQSETNAVNIENIARIYLGNGQYPMRTHHEGNSLPGLWIHTIPYMSK